MNIPNKFLIWKKESSDLGGFLYGAVVFSGAYCWVQLLENLF